MGELNTGTEAYANKINYEHSRNKDYGVMPFSMKRQPTEFEQGQGYMLHKLRERLKDKDDPISTSSATFKFLIEETERLKEGR